jgi:RNase P subunit RPR2
MREKGGYLHRRQPSIVHTGSSYAIRQRSQGVEMKSRIVYIYCTRCGFNKRMLIKLVLKELSDRTKTTH